MIRDPTHLFEGEVSSGFTRFAKAVSLLSQAPLISVPVFMALNLQAADTSMFLLSTIICIVTATVIPTVMVHHYSVKFNNDDGDIVRREDRFVPLLLGTASYLLGYILLALVGAPAVSTTLMLCYVIVTGVIIVISTRWKISIHATGPVGPILALSYAYGPAMMVLFVFLPVIMVSRYVLGKHTPAQLVCGAALGAVLTIVLFSIPL